MKKSVFLFVVSILFRISAVYAQSLGDKAEILSILNHQTERWNVGDIDGFMKGYWENDSLMYIGKNGVTYGYKATLDRYKKTYSDKAKMGTLKFDIIKVSFIGKDGCWVLGKWHLYRPEAGDIGGYYTLLWKKINGKWVIVADHSS
jgi:hypothetical protein